MPDREKVIKGVEHCFHGQECCGDIECPYYIEHLSDSCCLEECQENLKTDVIALLKEQQQQIWELQDQVEYLADKLKEQDAQDATDIRDIDGLWCDDITFCQELCNWESCPRNQQNIRDRSVPHSFSVGIPEDCPKWKEGR